MTTIPLTDVATIHDDYDATVVVRAHLSRNIVVTFTEPIPIIGSDGAPGEVFGFRYNDGNPADEDPAYTQVMPGVPMPTNTTPLGHLLRKNGEPRAKTTWAFYTPARRVVTAWCEAHPNWWKVDEQ